MSFVDVDDVIKVNEGFLKRLFKEALGVDIETPIKRLSYKDAMERFGSDKPDLRFGFEIKDISDIAGKCGFSVFSGAVEKGGSVRIINVEGGAKFTRKEIDALQEHAKTYRAKGLAWLKLSDAGEISSSFAKFLTEDEVKGIIERANAKNGDLILAVADEKTDTALISLGALRCECAKRLGILKKGDWKLVWITEFPLLEYSEEEGRFTAMHHPFTSPLDEDLDKLESDPGKVRAKAYDIVLNGVELGGGSIRIHSTELQARMFRALGFTDEDTRERFGHLLDAFKYGAPPHGGLAYGLDRICMLLLNRDSIRDVIAFPKVQNASELMMGSPSPVEEAQLQELCLKIDTKE